MSLAELTAAVMFLGVVLYAVFGGADFGSGVWDLSAGRTARGAPTRRLIDHAIGPVWEANHVWLIFVLVFLWGGFPTAFVAIMTTLAIPFWFAALGVALRGAGFAYRKYAPGERSARVFGSVFAFASLITPFFFGMIVGGIASGRVTVGGGDPITSWLNPTSLLGGVLAVMTTTYLAGSLLTTEAAHLGLRNLTEELRRKTLIGGFLVGPVVMAGIPVLWFDAPTLAHRLLGPALPAAIISAAAGTASMWFLWNRRYTYARPAAAIAVAAVTIGWGVAQFPWILTDHLTIDDAAGASASLISLMVAFGIAGVLVIPPLVYLYRLSDDNRVGSA